MGLDVSSLPMDEIRDFCRRWKVVEFALFGSILHEGFGPESNVDVMVTFADDAPWSLFEFVDMIDELQGVFGRPVDMVEKDGIRNPFRRREILSNSEVVYAA